MIDRRPAEVQKAEADECYNRLKAQGRTCSGCHKDFYCQMPTMIGRWAEEFAKELHLNN